MDSVESTPDLFSKVGPLPAWAWGALVVGGYVVWSHMHASAPMAENTADTQTVDSSNDGSGDVSFPPTSFGAPLAPADAAYDYSTTLDGTYGGSVAGTVFTSNQQWAVYAIGNLTRAGYPTSTVTSGITHYLAGSPLTQAEQDVVTAAIQLIGPPPLPLPITPVSSGDTVAVQPSGGDGSTTDGTSSGGTTVATGGTSTATAPAPAPATTESPITVKNVLTGVRIAGPKVKLAWTPVPHADGYHIWKDGRQVYSVGSGTLTFTTQVLAPGKHTWWIQAYNKVSHLGGNQWSVTI